MYFYNVDRKLCEALKWIAGHISQTDFEWKAGIRCAGLVADLPANTYHDCVHESPIYTH